MRIGLIGFGRIGQRHAETLRGLEAVESLVVADADPSRARAVAGRLGLGVAENIDDLLAERPDGVVIAAPTPTHAELVRRVAAAGVPIFCEKPLASDIAGTREVLAVVEAAGVSLQLGFQRRFDPDFIAAKQQLEAGKLGRLHSILACTLDPAPPPPAYIPTSGGLFRDCSVHDIDAIRWATGRRIVEAVAVGANLGERFFAEAGDVDTAHAILTLDDGVLATIVASRYNGGGYEGRLELHGSLATATAGLEGAREVSYVGFADRFAQAYAAELRAFTRLVSGQGDNLCPGKDALEALYVAEACELSRREHRPVRLEEVS
ncbi:MAG TPA: Gfo/Idh/MocA family oxidoreductase [Actinopolymorphaceae bacterium]